ncbi:MAG TPA: hypothetical protein VIM99_16410 [Blastocatellia bacterium]
MPIVICAPAARSAVELLALKKQASIYPVYDISRGFNQVAPGAKEVIF